MCVTNVIKNVKKISKLNHQLGDLAYNKNVSIRRGRGEREKEKNNRINKELKLEMLLSSITLAYHA